MPDERDVVLVIAPSAGGKTEAIKFLRDYSTCQGIDYRKIPVTDAHTIIYRMREDDKTGGVNHFHPWCLEQRGHIHGEQDTPIFPFTVISNVIPDKMRLDFFNNLASLQCESQLVLAELSGAVNLNPPESLVSGADLSFERVAYLFRNGTFPTAGLKRVIAVIHPVTTRELRLALNEKRAIPTDEEVANGIASWPLDKTGMDLFGEDDAADAFYPLLEKLRIPIFPIVNDGTPETFETELKVVADEIFRPWGRTVEGGRKSRGPEATV